jgi:hypothetical protein
VAIPQALSFALMQVAYLLYAEIGGYSWHLRPATTTPQFQREEKASSPFVYKFVSIQRSYIPNF